MDAREAIMSFQNKVAIMTGGGVTSAAAAHDTRTAIENSADPKADNLDHSPHAAALSLCRVTVSRRPLPGHDAGQQNPAEQAV